MEPNFFYCNSLELATSPFDISFRFIRNEVPIGRPHGSETSGEVADSVTVVMSPQHAKATIGALVNAIRTYEKQFGELHLPKDAQALYEQVLGSKK